MGKRTKLIILAIVVALAVMGTSQIGVKKMPDNFVPVVTHAGDTIFFLADTISEMSIAKLLVNGGSEGDGETYEVKLKVENGTVYIKAKFNGQTENCDSGWVNNTIAECTTGTWGCRAIIGHNSVGLVLRHDSVWSDLVYWSEIDQGIEASILRFPKICLEDDCITEWGNLFEEAPTNGKTNKGPTSNWAYDIEQRVIALEGS